jgi:hypothetical protein
MPCIAPGAGTGFQKSKTQRLFYAESREKKGRVFLSFYFSAIRVLPEGKAVITRQSGNIPFINAVFCEYGNGCGFDGKK